MVRFPAAWSSPAVTINGSPVSYTFDSAAHRAIITGTLAGGNGQQAIVKISPFVTLSGTITLGGCVASAVPNQPVTFLFRPSGGGTVIPRTINLGSGGVFSISGLPAGTYNVAVKAAKWLQVLQTAALTADIASFSATLPGGDANGDNQVDLTDFGILVNAFGSSSGGSGYDTRADFSCDGSVDLTDFGILVNSFGSLGAP